MLGRHTWLALLGLVLSVQAVERYIEDTDRFPGWKGELPNNPVDQEQALSQQSTGRTTGYGEGGKVRQKRLTEAAIWYWPDARCHRSSGAARSSQFPGSLERSCSKTSSRTKSATT